MIRGVLLDEHYPKWWLKAILQHYPSLDLREVGRAQAPVFGAKDPDILQWIESRDFVVVTQDRKTMVGHLHDHIAAGGHVEGIFVADIKLNTRTLAEDLELIVEASYEGEFRDQLVELPL